MKTLLAAILSLAGLAAARGEDMQKYLRDTQQLVRQGQNAEALQRFIWFHENALQHDRGMTGVRLSFALSYWKELGDVYPPALTALVEMRDGTTKTITDGNGHFSLVHDAVALNRVLGHFDQTVALFQTLDQTNPKLAKSTWPIAKDAVIAAKRYDLVGKYVGDLEKAFGRLKGMYEVQKNAQEPTLAKPQFQQWNRNHFVNESVQLIEVALALDKPAIAKSIQQQALAVVDDDRLRDAISADE